MIFRRQRGPDLEGAHAALAQGHYDVALAMLEHAARRASRQGQGQSWLMLAELGYTYVSDSRLIIGDISGFHGHELNLNGNAVVPARGVFTKVLMNAFCAHLHRTSRYSEPVGDRSRTITTHTIGCLCDLEPAYAPYNKWNLGFAVIEVHKNGETEFHNFSMDRGSYKPVEV